MKQPPGSNEGSSRVYRVSEITRQVRLLLEDSFPEVWVEGEVSNYKEHSSGHVYFSLKDEASELRCVMFRGDAALLRFSPSDGMKVRALGRITVYEKRGYYQLQVFSLSVAGKGDLALAFEVLKEKLRNEGLFLQEHKKPLPQFPAKIGVVTASTGAAVKDILKIIGRRWPLASVLLRPSRVQGEGAAAEIAESIGDLNRWPGVELIIVGRGGGSLEDLWAFNEEIVARAIYDSATPVVSAVGHEVDYTIADFVADARAPTPSAAALVAVPDRDEIAFRLEGLVTRALRAGGEMVRGFAGRVDALSRSYGLRRPRDLIIQRWQDLDEMHRRTNSAVRHRLEIAAGAISSLDARVESAAPASVLSRGYCICRRQPGRELVSRSSELKKRMSVSLQFAEGSAECEVLEVEV
jgi:exodeoxyribonuclease VII large subunit